MNAACAFAFSGASRSRSLALSSSSRDCSTIVSGGHAANVSSTTPAMLIGRRLALSCCSGGFRTGPPSNTRRRRLTDHAVDKRTVEQGAAAADHNQPKPVSQQRSCNARRNRSMSAPSLTAR